MTPDFFSDKFSLVSRNYRTSTGKRRVTFAVNGKHEVYSNGGRDVLGLFRNKFFLRPVRNERITVTLSR